MKCLSVNQIAKKVGMSSLDRGAPIKSERGVAYWSKFTSCVEEQLQSICSEVHDLRDRYEHALDEKTMLRDRINKLERQLARHQVSEALDKVAIEFSTDQRELISQAASIS